MSEDLNRDLEGRLRRALAGEAESVRPSDGLARIRAAIADDAATAPARRRRWWRSTSGPLPTLLPSLPRFGAPLAAAAAILALAVLTPALFRLAGPTPESPAGEGPSVVASGVSARVEPLPVYFLTLGPDSWALTREFQPTTLTDPAERLRAAVRLAVTGAAADQGYTSVWRQLELPTSGSAVDPGVQSTAEPDSITVQLGVELTQLDPNLSRPPAVTPELAQLAVEQLVWTATAAAGKAVPVAIHIEGAGPMPRPPTLFGVDLGRPFERTIGDADPRVPIWISSLREGDTLSTGTATITGDSARSNTSATWSLYRSDGVGLEASPAASGTTSWVPEDGAPTSARRAWQLTMPLPQPGIYVLSVEQDGYKDDKQFTVR